MLMLDILVPSETVEILGCHDPAFGCCIWVIEVCRAECGAKTAKAAFQRSSWLQTNGERHRAHMLESLVLMCLPSEYLESLGCDDVLRLDAGCIKFAILSVRH